MQQTFRVNEKKWPCGEFTHGLNYDQARTRS